jgi:hypothetical protein
MAHVIKGDLSSRQHHCGPTLNDPAADLARIRFANALLLFEEFVQQAARNPDAATLRGLEGRFAERLGIQPSYWSQIKSGSRQIGERLARQFEARCRKPYGWMDRPQGGRASRALPPGPPPVAEALEDDRLPHDEDERFIVSLVLTYYRRHPERARARLLELLGEVLAPPPAAEPPAPPVVRTDDDADLWRRSSTGVAPLKRKR